MSVPVPVPKDALRELTRAGEAYRFLLSERDLAVLVLSETVEDCNEAACQLFGVTREEFIGRSPLEYAPPYQPDGSPSETSARERLASALAGLPQWCTWQYRRKDGRPVDTLVHVEAVRVDGARRVLIRIRDVSRLERAETALAENETRMKQILDNTTAAIVFAKDLAGRYLFVNRAFERIVGLPQREIVGKTTPELFPAATAAKLMGNDASAVAAGNTVTVEEDVEIGGQVRTLLTNKFPLFDSHGRPYAMCGIAADITERKRTEEALKRAALAVSVAGGVKGLEGLVEHLAAVLGTDVAFVAVFTDAQRNRMRTLAAWLDGRLLRNYEYHLTDSPCAGIIGRVFRFVPSGALAEIPPGTMFHAKGMDGYAAYALMDASGAALGLIAVMNRAPLAEAERVEAILKIFAVRAAAEIERTRAEEALRSAALAVSGAAGDAVFAELVRALAAILDVQVAFIALPAPENPGRLRMLAFYVDGRMIETFEYPMAGTPCEQVIAHGYQAYRSRLRELFPLDEQFVEMGVESYAGFPLRDAHGGLIGIISIVDRKPLGNPELVESMLKIFAARAVTEIERRRAEAALRTAESSYRAIFESAEDPIFVHDWETGAVLDVNHKACEVYGYTHDELKRITVDEISSGEPPYTAAEAARWIERAKAEGAVEFEWHRRNRDGSLHWDEVRLKSAVIGGQRRVLAFVREITERKLAEAQLRAREEQYRAIFNGSADALMLWNSSLQRVDVNPAYERIYGYSREEVLGGAYLEAPSPAEAEWRRSMVRRTLAGEPWHAELESVRKDGQRVQVEVRTIPIQYAGEPHVLAIVRDVTERKRAEAQLRASEEQYRAIFNGSDDALVLWDSQLRRVDINPGYERIYGYTREEVFGPDYATIVPAHYAERRRELVLRALAGEPCQAELETRRKDGERIQVEVRTIPIQHRGEPHVLAISRDITERGRAEAAVRASEEQYRGIFNASVDGMLLWDAEHRIVDVNEAFCRMHGCRREDVVGQTDPEFIPEALRAQCMELLPEILAGKPCHIEAHGLRRDGTQFDMEVHGIPMHYRGQPHVLVILRDVTERKRAAERLRQSEERYRQLFDMESDAILLVDAESLDLLDANRAAAELYGYPREELLALTATDISVEPTDTRSSIHRHTGTLRIPLRYHRKKDGTIFPVEISSNLLELDGRRMLLAAIRDITERKRAEEKLRESEERYRLLFEMESDAIVVVDVETMQHLDVNRAAVELYGYTREELLSLKSTDVSAEPEDTGAAMRAGSAQPGTGAVRVPLRHHRKKDGTVFPVEITANFFDLDGRRIMVAAIRDITDRQAREEALRRSEEQYRAIFNVSLDGMLIRSLDGEVVDVNPSLSAMYGYSREELIGQNPSPIIASENLDAFRQFIVEAASGRPYHVESMAVRRDGSRFFIEAHGSLVTYRGRPHILSVVRDVTQRKAGEARLRATVEAALESIIIMDERGAITEFNPAAERCFGLARAQAIGRPFADTLFPERFREGHRRGLEQYLATGSGPFVGKRIEVTARRSDGSEFPAELAIAVAHESRGRIFVGYLRDITERKRAESDRGRLEAQLRQAQKMEAIGQLTGGIAHDFNNILTSILGYIVLGAERQKDLGDAKLGKYLEQAQRAAQRARDLIQQMLTFSRGQRGERRPVALGPLVTESVKLLRSSLPATVELDTEIVPGVPAVLSDPVHLEQVLLNLCINARDAMNGAGEIRVGVRRMSATDAFCASCRQKIAGRFVELWVADGGSGIAPDVLDRMFEPFFTTKDVGRGSGMGLAMVHGIVHDHGGHIIVDTVPGIGTTFRLCFAPVEEGRAAESPSAPPVKAAAPRPQLAGRVLVVDDEEMVGDFMAEMLSNWGLDVTVKRSPIEAEVWYSHDPRRVDLVITDQTMPRLTGVELAQRLTGIRPELPVILYTGFGDAVTDEAMARSGVCALLRKPVDTERLLALLRAHLPNGQLRAEPAQLPRPAPPSPGRGKPPAKKSRRVAATKAPARKRAGAPRRSAR